MTKGQTIRITAWPRCAIQADAYLPLDGLLHSALMRRTFGAEEITVPGDMAQYGGAHGSIPLRRVAVGGIWFYACSFAEWGPHVDDRSFWVRRFDLAQSDFIDFGKRKGAVTTSEGMYKGYQVPVFVRHALWVRWYAVGDIERVADLLSDATHIGKKATQGWGRVNRWEVEPWPEDWSLYKDGMLTRALPSEKGILFGVRPPYWKRGNQTTCRLPEPSTMGCGTNATGG